jgi:hypothetical protein
MENASARKRIYRCFRRILIDSRERNEYWQELYMSALREALLLMQQRSTKIRDARIEEALYYLSQRLREPVRIQSIAGTVGLSPSRLSYLFKEHTGQSIIDAVTPIGKKDSPIKRLINRAIPGGRGLLGGLWCTPNYDYMIEMKSRNEALTLETESDLFKWKQYEVYR